MLGFNYILDKKRREFRVSAAKRGHAGVSQSENLRNEKGKKNLWRKRSIQQIKCGANRITIKWLNRPGALEVFPFPSGGEEGAHTPTVT